MKKQEPISIKYLDVEIYNKLLNIAKAKGCISNKKIDLFNFIFKDYINMHELDNFQNPYLIKHVEQIITSATNEIEKRLGGRLFTTVGEVALNVSVLNQIIFEYMNKYEDTENTEIKLKQYREKAVQQLHEKKLLPMRYIDLVKDKDN